MILASCETKSLQDQTDAVCSSKRGQYTTFCPELNIFSSDTMFQNVCAFVVHLWWSSILTATQMRHYPTTYDLDFSHLWKTPKYIGGFRGWSHPQQAGPDWKTSFLLWTGCDAQRSLWSQGSPAGLCQGSQPMYISGTQDFVQISRWGGTCGWLRAGVVSSRSVGWRQVLARKEEADRGSTTPRYYQHMYSMRVVCVVCLRIIVPSHCQNRNLKEK